MLFRSLAPHERLPEILIVPRVLAVHGPVSQEQKTGMQREEGFKILLRDSEGSATGVADANCPPEITVLDIV